MMIASIENSPQRYARIGGVVYLAIIVLGIFGEAFVDGDGHRVDPATVRQGMRVPEAEWERWRDGSLRDIVPEHVAFDLYGNVVERWRPPPSDPGANLSSCWIPDVG